MIPNQELYLRLDTSYSQLNSNKKLEVVDEIKDIILNNATSEFIDNILNPLRNNNKLSFEETELIYRKLQRLVSDKEEVVLFNNKDSANSSNFLFDNEICKSPNPQDNLKELYYGFTFKPYNMRDLIKGTLKYNDSSCSNISFDNDSLESLKQYYCIIPLSDFEDKQYLIYKANYGHIGTETVLYSKDSDIIDTYDDTYKFVLSQRIINKIHDVYDMFTPHRIEIAYERLDGIYAENSIIIKDNTKKYSTLLNVGSIKKLSSTDDSLITEYTFTEVDYTQAKLLSNNNDITKLALFSNKSIIDMKDNYYYQKNKIKEVPIALRNNMFFISNLLPKYIPVSIVYTYIRKPIVIDKHLNQGLELDENVEAIITIASRFMTAYTSNPSTYQIANNEQVKIN
jgi:hypothetical protein